MTRHPSFLRATTALTAAIAVVVLAGCAAQPASTPTGGATAAPASVQRFACPTQEEVAALTAVPFTASAAAPCTYTATDASVALRHPAGAASTTLAALRDTAIGHGERTTDAPTIAFDAFTSTTKQDCTVWFPAVDGVASSVTARRSGESGTEACALATAVATLAGGSAPSSVPTVALVASGSLLGTATADQRWPWRIGSESGLRIDRLTGSGYLAGSTSFSTLAARVPTDSAAVVFVSGAAEAGTPSFSVLQAATRALSVAAARAPKAKLIVVGPVADDATSSGELATLQANLRAVAKIAGARYVDPSALTGSSSTVLAGVSDEVAAALRADGLSAG